MKQPSNICRLILTTLVTMAGLCKTRAQEKNNLPGTDSAVSDTSYNNSRFQHWLFTKMTKTEYKTGFKPTVFYNYNDKLYVGIGYEIVNHKENKKPFASRHGIYTRYSIPQNAFSFGYYGIINHAIGKWDLLLNADYDAVRWTNFFGIGNESTADHDKNLNYYRVRTHEAYAGVSLSRQLGTGGSLRFTPFYQGTKIINDEGRFLSDYTKTIRTARTGTTRTLANEDYDWDNYAGVAFNYTLLAVNDMVVPRKGVALAAGGAYTKSLNSNRSVNTYSGAFNFYIPLSQKFVFASRNGGATVMGEPKFYQLASIGGGPNVRGYRRDRFWGTSSAFTSNELQYLFNVRGKAFNGTIAPFAFYDIGRVWDRGEESNLWHSGYGGGLIVAPFNKIALVAAVGASKEGTNIHFVLRKAL